MRVSYALPFSSSVSLVGCTHLFFVESLDIDIENIKVKQEVRWKKYRVNFALKPFIRLTLFSENLTYFIESMVCLILGEWCVWKCVCLRVFPEFIGCYVVIPSSVIGTSIFISSILILFDIFWNNWHSFHWKLCCIILSLTMMLLYFFFLDAEPAMDPAALVWMSDVWGGRWPYIHRY